MRLAHALGPCARADLDEEIARADVVQLEDSVKIACEKISRADGSHVRVAVSIVNNNPETMERIRPHVKVGSSHDAR